VNIHIFTKFATKMRWLLNIVWPFILHILARMTLHVHHKKLLKYEHPLPTLPKYQLLKWWYECERKLRYDKAAIKEVIRRSEGINAMMWILLWNVHWIFGNMCMCFIYGFNNWSSLEMNFGSGYFSNSRVKYSLFTLRP